VTVTAAVTVTVTNHHQRCKVTASKRDSVGAEDMTQERTLDGLRHKGGNKGFQHVQFTLANST
jgi:hypothetical protein